MILAIGAIGHDYDPEYKMIILELQKLGISPTGNKFIDKSRLFKAKQKQVENFIAQKIEKQDSKEDEERAELERVRAGATNLGELNRILLGI